MSEQPEGSRETIRTETSNNVSTPPQEKIWHTTVSKELRIQMVNRM